MEVTLSDLQRTYSSKADEELLALHARGTLTESAYTALEAELARRQLPLPLRPPADVETREATESYRRMTLASHWRGEASLGSAYWLVGTAGSWLVLSWSSRLVKATMRLGSWLLVGALFAATIGCDRVTKRIATESLAGVPTQSFLADTVRLTYAENPGGFLSLGANLAGPVRTIVFTIGTGVVLLVMVALLWRARWRIWRTVGLSLFIAGGLSNWFDRLVDGRVVDFLNVGVGWLRTGVFNVADMAVMLGVALFVLTDLRSRATPKPQAAQKI